MYNLKNIYASITLYPHEINLVVSDNNNQFHVLYENSIANDELYTHAGITNKAKFKVVLNQLINNANDYLGFKLEKVIVVLAELVDDLEINRFKTDVFFTGYDFNHQDMLSSEKNRFLLKNRHINPNEVLDLVALNYRDLTTGKISKNFKYNCSYRANVIYYTTKNSLVKELKPFLKRNIIVKIDKIVTHHMVLAHSIKQINKNNLFVYLGEHTTDLMLFMDNALVDLVIEPFGRVNFLESDNDSENKALLEFLVDSTARIGDSGSIGMAYTDGSTYKEIRAVTIDDLIQSVNEKTKYLIDFINTNTEIFFQKYGFLPSTLLFYTKSKQLLNNFQLNQNLLSNHFKTVTIFKNEVQFVSRKYLLNCQAIALSWRQDQINVNPTSFALPFYSDKIEKQFKKSFLMLKVHTHINKLVQKLIK